MRKLDVGASVCLNPEAQVAGGTREGFGSFMFFSVRFQRLRFGSTAFLHRTGLC